MSAEANSEHTPAHSIISSANVSSVPAIVRPIAFSVFVAKHHKAAPSLSPLLGYVLGNGYTDFPTTSFAVKFSHMKSCTFLTFLQKIWL